VFDSLLYVKFVFAILVFMLTIMQVFNDVLLSTPMIGTLMSLMVVVVIENLMKAKFAPAIPTFM
jgi:hypothetical protein